jgi:hypothetical protein
VEKEVEGEMDGSMPTATPPKITNSTPHIPTTSSAPFQKKKTTQTPKIFFNSFRISAPIASTKLHI